MARSGEPAPDGLVTLPQVAEALGLSLRSVQRRVRALGMHPTFRRGGIDYYAQDKVDRLRELPTKSQDDDRMMHMLNALIKAHQDAVAPREALIAELRHRAERAEADRETRPKGGARDTKQIAKLSRRAEVAEAEREQAGNALPGPTGPSAPDEDTALIRIGRDDVGMILFLVDALGMVLKRNPDIFDCEFEGTDFDLDSVGGDHALLLRWLEPLAKTFGFGFGWSS